MSRFVSAGTQEDPPERDAAWLAAQQELDASRMRKEEAARQDTGKSLYETLQANKAAKQEAFEESIRLKNQFRSLDEDEIDFLDSVLESTRANEAAVARENAEQLELFRRQREEAEAAARAAEEDGGGEGSGVGGGEWAAAGRKRRRAAGAAREGLLGVKVRRVSSAAAVEEEAKGRGGVKVKVGQEGAVVARDGNGKPSAGAIPAPEAPVDKAMEGASRVVERNEVEKKPAAKLGLAAYSSDDDD